MKSQTVDSSNFFRLGYRRAQSSGAGTMGPEGARVPHFANVRGHSLRPHPREENGLSRDTGGKEERKPERGSEEEWGAIREA